MVQHVNFYENLKEASMRLTNTVVMYDDKPYYILTITDHKDDGIFRVYLDALGPDGLAHQKHSVPYEWLDDGEETRGKMMDDWLDKNPDKGVLRKMMNSPKFGKFRPFPLGMCNHKGAVVYIERTPTRYTQQGLTNNMVTYTNVSEAGSGRMPKSLMPSILSEAFYNTIIGDYPDPHECLKNMNDPEIINSGVAFHRDFAFVRGPVNLLFLAYKDDVVGYLPNSDFSRITIAPKFGHTKEVIDGLQLFEDIRV